MLRELCSLLDRLGLFYQHNGDIILDFVAELTRVTYKSVSSICKVNVALAFRARQDLEQFLTYRHRFAPIERTPIRNI